MAFKSICLSIGFGAVVDLALDRVQSFVRRIVAAMVWRVVLGNVIGRVLGIGPFVWVCSGMVFGRAVALALDTAISLYRVFVLGFVTVLGSVLGPFRGIAIVPEVRQVVIGNDLASVLALGLESACCWCALVPILVHMFCSSHFHGYYSCYDSYYCAC